MSEITEQLIAQIASRLYNQLPESPAGAGNLSSAIPTTGAIPSPTSVPSSPGVPSPSPHAVSSSAVGSGVSAPTLFSDSSLVGAPAVSSHVPSIPGHGGVDAHSLPHLAVPPNPFGQSIPSVPTSPVNPGASFPQGMPVPGRVTPPGVTSIPAPPSQPQVPTATPSILPAGNSAGIPGNIPAGPGANLLRIGSVGFPFSTVRRSANASQVSAGQNPNSQDGLKRFVDQVRSQTYLGAASSEPSAPFAPVPFTDPAKSMGSGGQTHHGASRPMDVHAIRRDFPILQQKVHGKPLAWFDNAATTQKPQRVIDAISRFYENDNSNIHRAAHTLAARATDAYERSREKVRGFLGAGSVKEIVFVRGTTEAINLIAQTYGRKFLQSGDEIILSQLEHHANIVPWQMVAKEKGAVLRVIPVNDRGEVILEEYQRLLGPRTKLVALTQASNSLGTILPVAEMTHMAKRHGARVLIDGAQSVSHIPVNVREMGTDFFVFSGHKIFGPTGIGVAYITEEMHDILPPWQGGGNMIRNVTFEETTYSDAPAKFEAGTPNIADAVGLGAALEYVERIGLHNIGAYEHHLLEYATEQLSRIDRVHILGSARHKVSVISFVMPHRAPEEIGKLLDQEGIAVRSGHHCSQPSLRRFGVEATVRPSFAFYNTIEEIDRMVCVLRRI